MKPLVASSHLFHSSINLGYFFFFSGTSDCLGTNVEVFEVRVFHAGVLSTFPTHKLSIYIHLECFSSLYTKNGFFTVDKKSKEEVEFLLSLKLTCLSDYEHLRKKILYVKEYDVIFRQMVYCLSPRKKEFASFGLVDGIIADR